MSEFDRGLEKKPKDNRKGDFPFPQTHKYNFMHCKGEELRAPQTFVLEGQGLGRWARRGLTKLEENTRSLVGIFRSATPQRCGKINLGSPGNAWAR